LVKILESKDERNEELGEPGKSYCRFPGSLLKFSYGRCQKFSAASETG